MLKDFAFSHDSVQVAGDIAGGRKLACEQVWRADELVDIAVRQFAVLMGAAIGVTAIPFNMGG